MPQVLDALGHNVDDAVFSFIPNTAEVAFIGLVEGLGETLEREKTERIMDAAKSGELSREVLENIMRQKLRVEKVALKDIKLRTFIAEGESRNDLAAHVYDVTYGIVNNDRDTLVVIDDSIVRGTTLRQSIIPCSTGSIRGAFSFCRRRLRSDTPTATESICRAWESS